MKKTQQIAEFICFAVSRQKKKNGANKLILLAEILKTHRHCHSNVFACYQGSLKLGKLSFFHTVG